MLSVPTSLMPRYASKFGLRIVATSATAWMEFPGGLVKPQSLAAAPARRDAQRQLVTKGCVRDGAIGLQQFEHGEVNESMVEEVLQA